MFSANLNGLRDAEIFRASADAAEELALVTGQKLPESRLEINNWQEALARMGLTITDVATLTIPELQTRIASNLVPSFKAAREEVEKTRLAFDEAKKGMSEFFTPFKTDIDLIKQANEQSAKFTGTFEALTTGTRTQAEGLAFASEALTAATNVAIATQAAGFDAQVGLEASGSFMRATFEDLQGALSLSNARFEEFLRSVGLFDLYNASINSDSSFVGTIKELSEDTGIATGRLQEILNLTGELNNAEVKLVVTAETRAAAIQLAAIEGTLDGMSADGVERANDRIRELLEQLGFLSTTIRGLEEGEEGGRGGLSREELDRLISRARGRTDIEGTDPNEINRTFLNQRREAEAAAAEEAERARREAERFVLR